MKQEYRFKGNTVEDEKKLQSKGLHFCKNYQNLVRYSPELCGKCKYNGRDKKGIEENCP